MLHMYEVIKKIARKVGKEPLCNGKAERAPYIFGKCFILCWRCTSLIFSLLLCSCLCYIFTGAIYIELEMHGVIYAGILILPTLVDGILQYIFCIESTNIRRALFGCISGIGLWLLASWLDAGIGWITAPSPSGKPLPSSRSSCGSFGRSSFGRKNRESEQSGTGYGLSHWGETDSPESAG